MSFQFSPRSLDLQARLKAFMDQHIYPNEHRFEEEVAANRRAGNVWVPTRLIDELKPAAREAGLWNLFLPRSARVPEGLSNLDYAPLCEIMGRVHWAPEVFNCSAPDTATWKPSSVTQASRSSASGWIHCCGARSDRRLR